MTMIKCEECKAEISKSANVCPKCGHPNKKAHLSAVQVIVVLFLAGLGFWYFVGGGLEPRVQVDMGKIYDQVAADAVAQYNIAKKQGDKIQICVQAGLVCAGYLQAKDEPNYQKWKNTEKEDCREAGVPR